MLLLAKVCTSFLPLLLLLKRSTADYLETTHEKKDPYFDLTGCDKTANLTNQFRNYEYSICFVNLKLIQSGALQFCRARNMSLLTLSSNEERNALFEWLDDTFLEGKHGFWISGMHGPSFVDTNDGISPIHFSSTPFQLQMGGSCLMAGRILNPYWEIMTNECHDTRGFFCRYRRQPKYLAKNKKWTNFKTFQRVAPPLPDLSVCSHTDDLYDSNGYYIASTCFSETQLTNQQAAEFCKSHNMQLFTINERTKLDTLLHSAHVHLGVDKEVKVWISGMDKPNYVDTNNPRIPLPEYSHPENFYFGGTCIMIGTVGAVWYYELMTYVCLRQLPVYCEWQNQEILRKVPGSPKLSVCRNSTDLTPLKKKRYLKSVCYSEVRKNHTDAADFCKENNMKLFTITDDETREALLVFAEKVLGVNHTNNPWVSGINGPPYFQNTNDGTPLASHSEPFHDSEGGNCVSIGSYHLDYFLLMRYDCEAERTIMCEWTNQKLEWPPDVVKGCSLIKDLYNSEGVYMKSTCWTDAGLTNYEAGVHCRKHFMRLFTITNDEEREALFASTARQFGVKGMTSIWISGIHGPYWADTNDRSTLLDVSSEPTEDYGGDCLTLGSFVKPHFELVAYDCAQRQSHYCEWHNHKPSP